MKTTRNLSRFIITSCFISFASMSWSQSEAIYDISITTIWNEMDHTTVPGSAHWSELIGATHNTTDEFMSVGNLATLGIKNVAEFGSNSVFRGYVSDAINIAGTADQLLEQGFTPNNGDNDNVTFANITVSENFPLITLVSMVAPSPDWFIAVNSESLRSGNPAINNGWKDDFTIDVFAYDAGTDNGTDYTSNNSASMPFVPISMITGPPIDGNKMATISFDYKSSTLGIDDLDINEITKVYPSPASDVLTVTNTSVQIASLELYDILGKRVSFLTSEPSNTLRMDVRGLQSGIYILKIQNSFGTKLARKVIIE